MAFYFDSTFLEKKKAEQNEISVPTAFGSDLVACIGGDSSYPEIYVYLRKPHGGELNLAVVSDLATSDSEDAIRIAVYSNPQKEDMAHRFLIPREDIESDSAMFC